MVKAQPYKTKIAEMSLSKSKGATKKWWIKFAFAKLSAIYHTFKYNNMSITSSTIGKRTFKVILLGDSSTGKTCIIERFVNNKFEDKDNVLTPLCSQLSALIFLVRMWRIIQRPADCSCGTQLVSRDIEVSFLVIWRMRSVLSLSSILQVVLPSWRALESVESSAVDWLVQGQSRIEDSDVSLCE